MWKKLRSPLGCVVLSALLLLGGMVGLFVLALRHGGDPYIAEVMHPNGIHRLRLLEVHDGPFEYRWKPPAIQRFLPVPGPHVPQIEIHLTGLDRMTDTPGTTFLFRAIDAQGRYADPMRGSPELEFVESTGFVFKSRIGMADYPHWGTYAFTRSVLPRRDKELCIRIRDLITPKNRPVDMKIPNPFYRAEIPEWQAETLPVTKTKGAISLRLEEVKFWALNIWPRFVATSDSPEWQSPSFQNTLEDATGNVGDILSPFEPVWKIKTQVYRSPTVEFPETLRTTIKDVPVLAPGTVKSLDRKLTFDGLECRVVYAAGAGIVHESQGELTARLMDKPEDTPGLKAGSVNGRSYMEVSKKGPFLLIELPPRNGPEPQFIVQLHRRGTWTGCELGYLGCNDKQYLVADIPAASDENAVELTMALNRPEEFEFFITPPAEARAELMKPDRED